MTTEALYFVRLTSTIEEDIERGTSMLTNHDNLIVDGLCAFGPVKSIEEANILASKLHKWYSEDSEYAIITGLVSFGKKGSVGTVCSSPKLISKHTF